MKQNYTGFTLIEVMIALFIFATITTGTVLFFIFFFRNYSFSFEESTKISTAEQSQTRLIREIREARSGDNGAWPIVETGETSFTFYSDVTGDGRSDRVRYFIEGTNLKRGLIEPTAVPVTYPIQNETITIVASDIADATNVFTYYNGDWPADTVNNPLPPANRILQTRYVTVSITIDAANSTMTEPYTLTTGVQIRSLKENL